MKDKSLRNLEEAHAVQHFLCYIYNPQANEDPSIDLASIQKHRDGLGHASLGGMDDPPFPQLYNE